MPTVTNLMERADLHTHVKGAMRAVEKLLELGGGAPQPHVDDAMLSMHSVVRQALWGLTGECKKPALDPRRCAQLTMHAIWDLYRSRVVPREELRCHVESAMQRLREAEPYARPRTTNEPASADAEA